MLALMVQDDFYFIFKYVSIYLAASGLSCYMQDLVPQPGIEPGLPTQNTRVPATGPPGKF